jgi:hypothetical protein
MHPMHLLSRRGVALAALAAGAAGVVPGAAAAAVPHRCSALRGRDLDRSATGRIVEARFDRGHTHLLGCVPPDGGVHVLTPPLTVDTGAATGQVLETRGRFAVVLYAQDADAGNGYADKRWWRRVFDLRSGRWNAIWTYGYDAGSEGERSYDLGDPKRTYLDAHGRAVVAYTALDATPERNAVAAFTATGRRVVLARGSRAALPVGSLGLDGETASWSLDGADQSAMLTALPADGATP